MAYPSLNTCSPGEQKFRGQRPAPGASSSSPSAPSLLVAEPQALAHSQARCETVRCLPSLWTHLQVCQGSLGSLAQQLRGQDTEPAAYDRFMARHEALHLLRELAEQAQVSAVNIAGCLTAGRRVLAGPCRELLQVQRMQRLAQHHRSTLQVQSFQAIGPLVPPVEQSWCLISLNGNPNNLSSMQKAMTCSIVTCICPSNRQFGPSEDLRIIPHCLRLLRQ